MLISINILHKLIFSRIVIEEVASVTISINRHNWANLNTDVHLSCFITEKTNIFKRLSGMAGTFDSIIEFVFVIVFLVIHYWYGLQDYIGSEQI